MNFSNFTNQFNLIGLIQIRKKLGSWTRGMADKMIIFLIEKLLSFYFTRYIKFNILTTEKKSLLTKIYLERMYKQPTSEWSPYPQLFLHQDMFQQLAIVHPLT